METNPEYTSSKFPRSGRKSLVNADSGARPGRIHSSATFEVRLSVLSPNGPITASKHRHVRGTTIASTISSHAAAAPPAATGEAILQLHALTRLTVAFGGVQEVRGCV
jgi:hypothetical protein